MAELKKSVNEYFQPLFDGRKIIFQALVWREQIRPLAAILIAPGMVGKECDLARAKTVAANEVKAEILQFIRPHRFGGLLRGFG